MKINLIKQVYETLLTLEEKIGKFKIKSISQTFLMFIF